MVRYTRGSSQSSETRFSQLSWSFALGLFRGNLSTYIYILSRMRAFQKDTRRSSVRAFFFVRLFSFTVRTAYNSAACVSAPTHAGAMHSCPESTLHRFPSDMTRHIVEGVHYTDEFSLYISLTVTIGDRPQTALYINYANQNLIS